MSLLQKFESLDVATVDRWIAERQPEHLELEFKLAKRPELRRPADRKILAKAISGFANAEGGLLVWGVDAREEDGVDCAVGKEAINNLERFLSRLRELSEEAVKPGVTGVQHKALPISNDEGLAVTLVPSSDEAPHRAELGDGRYYKRNGSRFIRMEHYEIADMFGRRKRPVLSLRHTPLIRTGQGGGREIFDCTLGIANTGRGAARATYLAVRATAPLVCLQHNPGLPIVAGVERDWRHFGADASHVIHPGTVHRVTRLQAKIEESNRQHDFLVECRFTAEDVQLVEGHFKIRVEEGRPRGWQTARFHKSGTT